MPLFSFINNMKIREATIQDAEIIAQNNNLMAVETEGKELEWDIIFNGVKAVINDANKGFYLVVEDEGKVAANLMITFEWSDWRNSTIWWIQSVYVVKEYRRKGLYKALYEETKKRAKEAGVKVIRLYVEQENKVAQKTYENLGMQHSYYYMYEADI